MIVKYFYDTHFPNDESVFSQLLKSHNNWIRNGVDDLKFDSLSIWTVRDPVIYNKVVDENLIDYRKMGKGVTWSNILFKSPFPVSKSHCRFICTPGTLMLAHFGHIDNNISPQEQVKRFKIIEDTLVNACIDRHGAENVVHSTNNKEDGSTYDRNDIIIKGKKVSGIDFYTDGKRFVILAGLQNALSSEDKTQIRLLMRGDKQWPGDDAIKMVGAAKLDVDKLVKRFQEEVDNAY